MSKLIIDMPMPKDCPQCPMAHYNKLDEFTGCEVAAGKLFAVTRDKAYAESTCRPDWCPICGVLPDEHGDLIDRDKFVDKYIRHYTEQERKMNLVFAAVEVKQDFADMIYEEDAVIAAERKDDEQIH